ncbi:MAG: hypothetical protein ABFC63_08960 [Thermoguttaceae bacterium]
MSIEFRCNQCGRLLRTGDDTAGRQAQCPVCGAIRIVPDATRPEAMATPAFANGAIPAGMVGDPLGNAPMQTPFLVVALQRVAGPATALMLIAGMAAVLAMLAAAFWGLAAMALASNAPLPPEMPFGPQERANVLKSCLFYLTTSAIWFFVAIAVYAGAARMKRLQSYGFAKMGAVLAVIPCVAPCCLLTVPFGVWALWVLNDPSVKAAFDRSG